MAASNFTTFNLSETDSTSLHAMRLLKEGDVRLPFLVTSQSQTSGRGQMGKTWESPKGNIYASFVVSSSGVPGEKFSLVPLLVGFVLGEWLYKTVGLSVHLKWPNDVLLNGKKVAGILCESGTHPSHGAYFLIGIGVNVEVAPEVKDYSTTSLAAELNGENSHKNLNAQKLSESLAGFFAEHFNFNELDNTFLNRLEKYLAKDGLWKNSDTGKFLLGKLHADNGALILHSKTDSEQMIYSANHSYEYCFQRRSSKSVPLVVADFGNTSLKLSVFSEFTDREPHQHLSLDYESSWEEALQKVRLNLLSNEISEKQIWPVYFVNVANPAWKETQDKFAQRNFQLVPVHKRYVRLQSSEYAMNELGIDRLALIEGYLKNKAKVSAMIVSLGTATTVDVVDASRKHLGGWILPGLQTAFTSLRSSTALLPELHAHSVEISNEGDGASSTSHPLGHNTKTAIYFGVIQAQVALLETLNERLGKVEIVLTGGYADLLRTFLNPSLPVTHDPFLVSKGIQAFVTG